MKSLLPIGICLVGSVFSQTVNENVALTEKADPSPLGVVVTVKKITYDTENKEVLSEVEVSKPGDLLKVQSVYKNMTKQELKSVIPELAVPKNTYLIKDSIKPTPSHVKIKQSFVSYPLSEELKLKYTEADFSAVRWFVDKLPSEAEERFEFNIAIK